MINLDAVGLIINPKAGEGYLANARAAFATLTALRSTRIFTGPGELGARALEGSDFSQVSIVSAPAQPGRAQTQAIAAQLAQAPISAIIVVGGDGTLADVACELIMQHCSIPLLGIGVGSTNAGNLITCRSGELERLNHERLQVGPVRALSAYFNDQLLGIGFNDCVLGFTVVGTVAGVVRNLDAEARLSGQNIPGTPRLVGTNRTIVHRTGPDGIKKIASGRKIATVVVGFAEKAFFAKAVAGGICLAALVNAPAGCLVADFPLVQIELEFNEILALPPISSAYVTLDENQHIRVSGTRKGTAVCVDGNPLKILHPKDTIEFGVSMDAVQSIRLV